MSQNSERQLSAKALLTGWFGMRTEFLRFILGGVVNTASTYVLYLLLLTVLPYMAAYSISYCAGIVLSYFVNAIFVFQSDVSWSSFLSYPAVYVVQYLLGAGMLWLLVERIDLSPDLAILAAVAIAVPITFVLSRLILTR